MSLLAVERHKDQLDYELRREVQEQIRREADQQRIWRLEAYRRQQLIAQNAMFAAILSEV